MFSIDNNLDKDIYDELCSIPTVDAHEHLPPEITHLEKEMDIFALFSHYTVGDLISAGATDADFAFWRDQDKPVEERWKRFKPFFSAIRTGTYARSVLISICEVLGFDDINDDTYKYVSTKLRESNKPGLYDSILKDKCNIAACIQCWKYQDRDKFLKHKTKIFHLAASPELVNLPDKSAVEKLGARVDMHISTLSHLLDAMSKMIEIWNNDPLVVGIKSAHAYERSLEFKKRTKSEAKSALNHILTGKTNSKSSAGKIILQDFLMYEMVDRATAVGMPIAIHTGIHAGNYNKPSNSNPLLLEDLISEFHGAKFDLFHGGMPWVREIALLAKYFPGVHLNMAWMHLIDAAQARSALSEWLDQIPNTKIFGFGGDLGLIVKVYGALKIARMNIARVLAEKISEGSYSRAEASMVARRLMFENPNRFYNLGLTK